MDRSCQFPLVMDNLPGTIALWQNGADNHRVAQFLGLLQGILVVADRHDRLHRRIHLVESSTEQHRVIHLTDRRFGNPKQPDFAFLDDPLLKKLLGQLKGVLVADRRQDGVRVVTLNQADQVLDVQRANAGMVNCRPVF